MGHDAVQAVVAAVQVDQNQTAARPSGQSGQRRLRERAGEDVIGVGDHRESRDRSQKKVRAFHFPTIVQLN